MSKTKKTKATITPEQPENFPIIGLGASAGGLEALKSFFSNVPAESGMAFVVVVHLSPKQPSMLSDLLDKATTLTVKMATDGEPIEINHVYVIPPGRDLTLFSGKVQLLETLPAPNHLPIDTFFKSLAQDQGDNAVAIILSGTGSDGTRGLREIKAAEGLVLVQDEESAGYDGMPRSALNTGMVDIVIPPQEMYLRLLNYFSLTTPTTTTTTTTTAQHDTPATTNSLNKIYAILRSRLGYDFSVYKVNTIRRRISRRMGLSQINNYEQYIRFLRENSEEVDSLFRELLIGVTSFFRDPESFETLTNKILPDLVADLEDDSMFRVWVPGCSTGEEAYSLAMILHEFFDSQTKRINLQIFGTDLASFSIDKARDGVYPESISADVSPERLKRFFIKENNFYRIRKEIRESVVFSVQNVLKDPPFSKLNMLCCRNVLIYFGSDAQKQLLPLFHYTLVSDGILMLGTSETIGSFTTLFEALDQKWKIYQRQEVPVSMRQQVEFPCGTTVYEAPKVVTSTPGEKTINIVQSAQKAILDQFAPTAVLIDVEGNILHIQGRVGKYLEPPSGPPTSNILDQARKGLGIELSSALRTAKASGANVTRNRVTIQSEVEAQVINLHVCPQKKPKELSGRFLVVFEDITNPPSITESVQGLSKAESSRVAELESELQYTRENHQTTVEELESSNEELKSTNEELQSSNEELQSTNEELESSKEELQSLNEEVQTVNSELQSKVEELSLIYDDMRNLLNSTEVATIFVDMEMRIRRFTSEATTIVNLIQSDIGRPLEHVVTNLIYGDMMKDLERVLENLTPRECEVQTTNSNWYSMRIIPYRTTDNRIAGAVLTFTNIDEQKSTQNHLTSLTTEYEVGWLLIRSVFDKIKEPLVIVDREGSIDIANIAFAQLFNLEPSAINTKNLMGLHSEVLRTTNLSEQLSTAKESFQDFFIECVDVEFPAAKMLVSIKGQVVNSSSEKEYRLLLTFNTVVKKQ